MENSPSFAYQIIDFLTDLAGPQAYALILFVLFVCGLGVPIPEDITLISAGILASMKQISLIGAFICCFTGVLMGDTLLFVIGYHYGRKVFKWPLFKTFFTPERIVKAEGIVHKHAKKISFMARFMPGLRAPIFLTSGILKVPFRIFIVQDGLAALISVPVWVYLGFWFGENIDDVIKLAKDIQFVIGSIVLVVGLFFIYNKIVKPRLAAPNKSDIKK